MFIVITRTCLPPSGSRKRRRDGEAAGAPEGECRPYAANVNTGIADDDAGDDVDYMDEATGRGAATSAGGASERRRARGDKGSKGRSRGGRGGGPRANYAADHGTDAG